MTGYTANIFFLGFIFSEINGIEAKIVNKIKLYYY